LQLGPGPARQLKAAHVASSNRPGLTRDHGQQDHFRTPCQTSLQNTPICITSEHTSILDITSGHMHHFRTLTHLFLLLGVLMLAHIRPYLNFWLGWGGLVTYSYTRTGWYVQSHRVREEGVGWDGVGWNNFCKTTPVEQVLCNNSCITTPCHNSGVRTCVV
jgi:hypothetical protein